MTMNWKWEEKVDNNRREQRAYEERKRREIANAKSASDLQKIERQLGAGDFRLRDIQSAAQLLQEQQERDILRQAQMDMMQMDMMRQYFAAPSMFGLGLASPWAEETIKQAPPKALTEDVIIEAVVGFRAWNVPLFGGGELQSTTRGEKWLAYQRLEAKCSACPCSGIQCECGIYAYKSIREAKTGFGPTDQRYSNRVYGSVSLWGRVLECANGYRAQYAYPKAILDTGALARQMAGRYGVPILAS